MKATEAYERYKSMNDQRRESLSTLFLDSETVSYGCKYMADYHSRRVFLPRNIMAIVLSENICLFPQLKLQKAHKVERGASPLL